MPKIQVLIDKQTGEATVRYGGFKGDECYRKAEDLYRRLKAKGLNVTVKESKPTPEDELYEVEGQAVTEG